VTRSRPLARRAAAGFLAGLAILAGAGTAAGQHADAHAPHGIRDVARWSGPALLATAPTLSRLPAADTADTAGTGSPFAAAFAMATLGSTLGLVAGWRTATPWGAMAGSVVGAAGGAHIATSSLHDDGPGRAVLGAIVGVVPGLAGAYVGSWTSPTLGPLLGYAVLQGLTTTWFAAPPS
jgi:hypothetical protein